MNRTIQFGLYLLGLVLIYFGFAIVFESCSSGNKKEDTADIPLSETSDEPSSTSYFEDEDTAPVSEYDAPTDESDEDLSQVDYTTPPPSQTPTVSTSTSSSQNPYLIIAGNFLVETNAQKMVSNLQSLGYSGAEYAIFDLSQYYTVIAGRYTSRQTASSISSELKSRGFDNYVLKSR